MRNKSIIVAGGAGFIGSHLIDALLERDNKVLCIDNLITGSEDNIKHLEYNKNFLFSERDISIPIPSNRFIDYIFNLASPASPKDYKKYPIETLEAGSIGTLTLLKLAKDCSARFILASTSEIYGNPKENPQHENYYGNVNTVGPRSCYDEAKRFSEALVSNYTRVYSLKTNIARIFNTYGPRMKKDDGRAIPTFINQCLENKIITINGDGEQTRSFCYIDDTVRGLIALADSNYYAPVNIGNPQEISILEVANRIRKLTKASNVFSFNELTKDDPIVRCPDIGRAKAWLNWEPKVDLDTGLKKTIEWFKSRH